MRVVRGTLLARSAAIGLVAGGLAFTCDRGYGQESKAAEEAMLSKEHVLRAPPLDQGSLNKVVVDPKLVDAAQYNYISPDALARAQVFVRDFLKENEKSKEEASKETAPVAGEAPGASVRYGYYRIEAVGFENAHETRDDWWATDGLGDEVQLRLIRGAVDVTVRDCQAFGSTVLGGRTVMVGVAPGCWFENVTGPIWGSVNSDEWRRTRIQAGSGDQFGGVRTGNKVPDGFTPDNVRAAQGFPLVMWEGRLIENKDVAIVVPMLWDWDGPVGLAPRVLGGLLDAAPIAAGAATAAAGAPPAAAGVAGAVRDFSDRVQRRNEEITLDCNAPGDRPVGCRARGRDDYYPYELIALDFATAEAMLAGEYRSPDLPVAMRRIGFRDERDYQGFYKFYWRVQRVGDVGTVAQLASLPRGP
jgi:hypothetical protein